MVIKKIFMTILLIREFSYQIIFYVSYKSHNGDITISQQYQLKAIGMQIIGVTTQISMKKNVKHCFSMQYLLNQLCIYGDLGLMKAIKWKKNQIGNSSIWKQKHPQYPMDCPHGIS